ncbi:MAG: hypothetical protein HYS21_07115 [Deltaproteobacteria bacterium]|nr:hypothetical protein [Deltaproteobacteria bacterium]
MRTKLLILFAVKMILIAIWFTFGWDVFKAKSVLAETPAEVKVKPPVSDTQAENEKGLIAALNRRQKELDAKEEELRVKEERLLVIKSDIDSRIAELNSIHGRIEAFTKKIDEVNDERVKRIVKIYGTMAPEEAATRIEKLDEDMAVLILSSLSEKKAAKILGLVELDKSVKLSKSLKIKN